MVEFGNVHLCAPAGRDSHPDSSCLICHERLCIFIPSNHTPNQQVRIDIFIHAPLPIDGSIDETTNASSSLLTISFQRSWKYTGSCHRRSNAAYTECERMASMEWIEGAKNSRERTKAWVVS
jgi:hypothetical protein